MMHRPHPFAVLLGVAALAAGCDQPLNPAEAGGDAVAVAAGLSVRGETHPVSPAVFDIAAAPDGSILVVENTTVRALRGGVYTSIITVPTEPGATTNGIAAIGAGAYFVTSGGLDKAEGAGLWRVSQGRARLVADIGAFERMHDPDAWAGPGWKDRRCEEDPAQGFTEGPQSNPYHVTALSGSRALVADAAGNTVLLASTTGAVDLVAVLTPPLDDEDEYMVLFSLPDGTDCYVQPVPTAVAVGPEGDYYVGELTGVTPGDLMGVAPTLSRVWRIDGGSLNVVCPSDDCRELVSGLTSVVDLAFGPDGMLYVAEMDANGWFAGAILGMRAGGRVSRCDPTTGACDVVAEDLTLPGAITFDRRGDAWILENGTVAPMVRRLELP
ncbi:MAG TPA: ScyD/ScyE family protein [Longimicrobiales bacterium]|nr:ScyD/ScyE family protein [Longimicrobiales bacterium]